MQPRPHNPVEQFIRSPTVDQANRAALEHSAATQIVRTARRNRPVQHWPRVPMRGFVPGRASDVRNVELGEAVEADQIGTGCDS